MNGKITLPTTEDLAHTIEVMERIEGHICSAIRGDYPQIIAKFVGNVPVYTIEISTRDFQGLIRDLEEDGFF